jgi:hypothetical protein
MQRTVYIALSFILGAILIAGPSQEAFAARAHSWQITPQQGRWTDSGYPSKWENRHFGLHSYSHGTRHFKSTAQIERARRARLERAREIAERRAHTSARPSHVYYSSYHGARSNSSSYQNRPVWSKSGRLILLPTASSTTPSE